MRYNVKCELVRRRAVFEALFTYCTILPFVFAGEGAVNVRTTAKKTSYRTDLFGYHTWVGRGSLDQKRRDLSPRDDVSIAFTARSASRSTCQAKGDFIL